MTDPVYPPIYPASQRDKHGSTTTGTARLMPIRRAKPAKEEPIVRFWSPPLPIRPVWAMKQKSTKYLKAFLAGNDSYMWLKSIDPKMYAALRSAAREVLAMRKKNTDLYGNRWEP